MVLFKKGSHRHTTLAGSFPVWTTVERRDSSACLSRSFDVSTYQPQKWIRAHECLNLWYCSRRDLTVILVDNTVCRGRPKGTDYFLGKSAGAESRSLGAR